MKIVTTCPSEYFGVSRVFEDGQSLGLWKHIPLENISLPLEADLVIMGGAHPTYHVLLDKIPQPKWIMWTSPLLQTELASVEMERLLYFAREPRIQRIWFGEKTASSLFKKAFYAPYPVAIDRVASSDMLVAESPFAAEVAKLDVVTPPEGIGFFVPFANKQKNVFTQLAAMKLFQETHPDVPLKTGGLLPEQARFADQIGLNYKDLGWRTGRDYYDDISQCKMTLHVSISESFGYGVMDSMLLGVPCLTSRAVSWVPLNLGLTCDPYDPTTIGTAISSLYSLEPVPPVRQIAKSVAMARNGQLESLMASWKDLLYNPEP